MQKQQFLEKLKEELEFDSEIDFNTNFQELEEWDSMSAMVLIGFVSDCFGLTLTGDDLKKLNSINLLITYIGADKFN